MAIYVFLSREGDVLERSYPMGKAPKIGEIIEVDGTEYARAPTIPQAAVVKSLHFKAHSLPTMESMEPALREAVPAFDRDGTPLFSSKKEVEEFSGVSRRLFDKGEVEEYFVYGDAPTGKEVRDKRMKRQRAETAKKLFGEVPALS